MASQAIINIEDLIKNKIINQNEAKKLKQVIDTYSLSITQDIIDAIKSENDIIYKQFIPNEKELEFSEYELDDPIGDLPHSPLNGLIHRYKNRVLIKPLSICPFYCRFCFRRETVGRNKDGALNSEELNKIFGYIEQHKEVNEVIFSGGDSFALSPRRIKKLLEALNNIDNVKTIRFHTRVPVFATHLITQELLDALNICSKRLVLVLHINHASELSDNAKAAIKSLRALGALILSQTVLLKDINDDSFVLKELFNSLIGEGVMPYYLHHPDLAKGTSHFYVSLEKGIKIYRDLSKEISGYVLPKYVLDIPNGFGKVPINKDYVNYNGKNWEILDKEGRLHLYPNII